MGVLVSTLAGLPSYHRISCDDVGVLRITRDANMMIHGSTGWTVISKRGGFQVHISGVISV